MPHPPPDSLQVDTASDTMAEFVDISHGAFFTASMETLY